MTPRDVSRTDATGATGDHTQRGVPRGVTSLTPYIGLADVAAAVSFYQEVFDVRVVQMTDVGGLVIHAELDFGNGHLHLEKPDPEGGLAGPLPGHQSTFMLAYFCEDVDATLSRALAAGAEALAPVVDFVSGDRFVAIKDPHGIQWSITSRVEDLSEAESAERVAAWADSTHDGD